MGDEEPREKTDSNEEKNSNRKADFLGKDGTKNMLQV